MEGSTLVTRKHSRQKPRIGNLAGKRQGSVVRSGLVGRKAQGSLRMRLGLRVEGEVYSGELS